MSYNNLFSVAFFLFLFKICVADCLDENFIAINIQISTGQNGSETTWQLFDTDTDELLAEASWFDNNSAETTTVCVPLHANLSFTIGCCINNEGSFEVLMQEVLILSGNTYQDNQTFYFTATPPTTLDAELQSLELPNYVLTKPHILSGIVRNTGLETINSLKINWQLNDDEPKETEILNINIASFENYLFELNQVFYPTNEGEQQLKIWLTHVNQNIDNNQDNDTLHLQTNSFFSFSENITLVENFTNASCSSCATIDAELTGLLQSNISPIAPISYHTPFPSFDAFYFANTTDIDTRLQAYEIAGVPSVYLSGTAVSGFFPVPTINQLQNLHNVPSFISLTLQEKIHINNLDTTLYFNIEIMPHIDINSENLRLHVVLIEKEIEADNIGSNGVNLFFYTMRKMLPHANGEVLTSMNKNEKYSYEFTHKIANYLNFNELRTIVFVQDATTKEIYQALLGEEISGNNQQSNRQYIGANFGQLDVLRQSPSCAAHQDGSITLTATGIYPPFSFLWENGNTTAFRSDISAGNYLVKVTDANETSQNFSIKLSTSPSFDITIETTASGPNEQNGTAFVTLVNAQEPVSYAWNNGHTSANIDNLAAGEYVVSITDAYGCMQSSSVVVPSISTSINNIETIMNINSQLYPNPAKNVVYLCTEQNYKTAPQVQVYDHLGSLQVVLEGEKTVENDLFSYNRPVTY
ncbi:MAG: Omp28-related outer membrane protein [Chitinophagales bacterium]